MTNRKYRVICLLNALERRLRELQGRGVASPDILDALYAEAPGIIAITAHADMRYLQGRLDYMLESYCGDGEGLGEARRTITSLLGYAEIPASRHAQHRAGIGAAMQ